MRKNVSIGVSCRREFFLSFALPDMQANCHKKEINELTISERAYGIGNYYTCIYVYMRVCWGYTGC